MRGRRQDSLTPGLGGGDGAERRLRVDPAQRVYRQNQVTFAHIPARRLQGGAEGDRAAHGSAVLDQPQGHEMGVAARFRGSAVGAGVVHGDDLVCEAAEVTDRVNGSEGARQMGGILLQRQDELDEGEFLTQSSDGERRESHQ
jgi:hypothetical protein